ncbi:MAG TPA: hypothetical protein VHO25_19145, partial [Polyangiaceae bacterium]|nr:hypothetical protein [Polyangiaceae bacterium]
EGVLFSNSSADFDTQDALGQPQKVRYRRTSLGLASPSWGIAGGYAITDHFLLGLRTTLEHATTEITGTQTGFPASKSDYTAVSFAPFLKVMMMKGSVVVPYGTGTIGYRKVTTDTGTDTDGVSFGGGLGLLIFPNPFFSIEPAASLVLDKVESGGATSTSSTSTGVYITLALSGWFGKSTQATREDYIEEESSVEQGDDSPAAELTLSVVDEANTLDIAINPADRLPQFSIKLNTVGQDSSECQTLTIASNEQVATLPAQNATNGEREITSQVPYKAMQAGVTEGRSVWTRCGTSWELSGTDRRQLLDFLNQFRQQAERQGTLEAARKVPMPEGGKIEEATAVEAQPAGEPAPDEDTLEN